MDKKIIAKQTVWITMQRNVCKPRKAKHMEEDCANSVCRHCGKPNEKQITGRRRIYCSEEYRRAWSKNHLPLDKHECIFCGEKFESSSKMQKFCSHDCYIRDRFWRKEEAEEIIKMFLTGKKVLTVHKWIKDILNGEINESFINEYRWGKPFEEG